MQSTEEIKAVIGTNAWGSALYEKAIRGTAVDDETIKEAVKEAIRCGLPVFDTAQDYGFGKGQKMVGAFCPKEKTMISAKYTPIGKYKHNQVHDAIKKDLQDFQRTSVDIYWLHLPNSMEDNLQEMIELYRKGVIGRIGLSNFNLTECIEAKKILDEAGLPLYGVQNHYSLLDRTWEENGLVQWCRENNVSFWAWAVLEEGILAGPKKKDEKNSLLKLLFAGKRRKLCRLFSLMQEIGQNHHLTIAQVAIAYVTNKGIIPVCGCRKPYQVRQLGEAVQTVLTAQEMLDLETLAAKTNVRVLGADMFRFAVGKR